MAYLTWIFCGTGNCLPVLEANLLLKHALLYVQFQNIFSSICAFKMGDLLDDQIRAEMFSGDKNIDRQKCKRIVPLEVLNLSMPRTGTMCMYSRIDALISLKLHLLHLRALNTF